MKAVSILIFSFGALITGWYIWNNTYLKNESLNEVVGNYVIDLSQTNLGYYDLTFESNATFHFNIGVPFIYDSTGTWKVPGGMSEDWNYLYYHSNKKIYTQFSRMFTTDSTFCLNSVTPRKDSIPVYIICFKKVKR
jgi:hypothetical protein